MRILIPLSFVFLVFFERPHALAGDVGAGIFFNKGLITAKDFLQLEAHMILDLESKSSSDFECCTTSMNGSITSLEILAFYPRATNLSFVIWDWSCSELSPCVGLDGKPLTSPNYVFGVEASDFKDYLETRRVFGKKRTILTYRNITERVSGLTRPATWINRAYFKEKKSGIWKEFYSHKFQSDHVIPLPNDDLFL